MLHLLSCSIRSSVGTVRSTGTVQYSYDSRYRALQCTWLVCCISLCTRTCTAAFYCFEVRRHQGGTVPGTSLQYWGGVLSVSFRFFCPVRTLYQVLSGSFGRFRLHSYTPGHCTRVRDGYVQSRQEKYSAHCAISPLLYECTTTILWPESLCAT